MSGLGLWRCDGLGGRRAEGACLVGGRGIVGLRSCALDAKCSKLETTTRLHP